MGSYCNLLNQVQFLLPILTYFMDASNDVQDEQFVLCSVSFYQVSNSLGFDHLFQTHPPSTYSFNIPSVPCCMTSSLTMCTK